MSMNPGRFIGASAVKGDFMESCDLTRKKCKPCEGGIPPLTRTQADGFLAQTKGWKMDPAGKEISREFVFEDFVQALKFVNQVGEVAELEGHHPDILLFQYRNVRITLWTHAVGGLTENDFIVAAKVNELKG